MQKLREASTLTYLKQEPESSPESFDADGSESLDAPRHSSTRKAARVAFGLHFVCVGLSSSTSRLCGQLSRNQGVQFQFASMQNAGSGVECSRA